MVLKRKYILTNSKASDFILLCYNLVTAMYFIHKKGEKIIGLLKKKKKCFFPEREKKNILKVRNL